MVAVEVRRLREPLEEQLQGRHVEVEDEDPPGAQCACTASRRRSWSSGASTWERTRKGATTRAKRRSVSRRTASATHTRSRRLVELLPAPLDHRWADVDPVGVDSAGEGLGEEAPGADADLEDRSAASVHGPQVVVVVDAVADLGVDRIVEAGDEVRIGFVHHVLSPDGFTRRRIRAKARAPSAEGARAAAGALSCTPGGFGLWFPRPGDAAWTGHDTGRTTMGRKGRGKSVTPQETTTGPGRKVALAVVVCAAVGLAIASWRSAPPEGPTRTAPADAPERDAPAPARAPRTPAPTSGSSDATPERYRPLLGEWVRPDGGYVLAIQGVAEDGTATAGYFNPQPINVGRAEGRLADGALELFVELRDRNYPGSTYTLTHDAQADQLVGVYFQAVQRASYDVVFVRR